MQIKVTVCFWQCSAIIKKIWESNYSKTHIINLHIHNIMAKIAYCWYKLPETHCNLHISLFSAATFLHLQFAACPASFCLFPSHLSLNPTDTTQALSPSSPSTSEDLTVAISQSRRVQNTLRSQFSSVFRKRRGGGGRGICFHCSVEMRNLDHKGALRPVIEKDSWYFFIWVDSWCLSKLRLWIPSKSSMVQNFFFTSSFSLTLSSC